MTASTAKDRALWPVLLVLSAVLGAAIALAAVGGPWQVIWLAHLAALAYWRWGLRRPLRELLASRGRWGGRTLVATGALVPAIAALVGQGTSPEALGQALGEAGPAGIGRAVLLTVLVGGCMNAIPEELTFRGVLLSDLRVRGGTVLAVALTAVAFTAMHVPTWLSSGVSGATWLFQVADKLVLGLLTGWSAVRLRSIGFALGMHLGGNLVGVFLDSVVPTEGWAGLTVPNVVVLVVQAAATAALIAWLGRDPAVASAGVSGS